MVSAQVALRESREAHIHVVSETCPVCDQPIPNDKAEGVRARLEAREKALTDAARAAAAQQIAAERAQIEAAARAAIEKAGKEKADALKKAMDQGAAREAAARADGKNEADAELRDRLAVAEQAKADADATARERIAALEQEVHARDGDWQQKLAAAEQAGADARAAAQERIDGLQQAAQVREAELQDKVAAAAKEARAAAAAAAQERIAEIEQAARARDADWQDRFAAAELAKADADADAHQRIAALECEKQEAISAIETLQADHERTIGERVQEVREAIEKDKTDALNAEKAKHTEETQKLTVKLETITRQLEKKTAEELGEGAEVELFDALRAEFDSDLIERVGKGVSGADIMHTIIHNGRECGKVIYDSKNSTAWRDDYVSKLVQDQTAAKADYAVLSTFKFPAGARQVEVRETVVIVNPARAIAIAQIIRRQLMQVHTLRLSKPERAKKMAALFDYIISGRCAHLLDRIASHTEAMLKLQEKEMKAHEAHWKQEGTHLRSMQKVKAELENEIDAIIGTNDTEGDHEPT